MFLELVKNVVNKVDRVQEALIFVVTETNHKPILYFQFTLLIFGEIVLR